MKPKSIRLTITLIALGFILFSSIYSSQNIRLNAEKNKNNYYPLKEEFENYEIIDMIEPLEVPGGDMPGYNKFLLVGILLSIVILICISIMSKNYYHTKGTLYMFLGTMFFFYFIFNETINFMLFSFEYYYSWVNFLFFALTLLIVVGSLVLMVLGLVLVVRGGVWVARVSGVLLGFLSFILIELQPSIGYLAFFYI